MKKDHFTKNLERMINPIDVGSLHFLQGFSSLLPKKAQNQMIQRSAKNYPYMGFVVEPYSFFLCYELRDLKWAQELLSDDYELVKTQIFEEDIPKYYTIFGCFNVHTSTFWGTRMEFNIIARNKRNNLVSWVIVDYDTNTISFDKANGLSSPTTTHCIHTTDFEGNVIVDIESKKYNRRLAFDSLITEGTMTLLDQTLWLEGNFSVGYGRALSLNSSEAFSLKFNPKEVQSALNIPREYLNIEVNSWYPGLFHEEPEQIVCFPYAQHYLSDSPGYFSKIKNVEEMNEQIDALDFEKVPIYTTAPIRKMIVQGSTLSVMLIIVLLMLLVITTL